jgi:release factor glutamine methyltransferase
MSGRTVGAMLRAAGERIGAVDARVLLCHTIDCNSAYVAAHPEAERPASEAARFGELVERRARGEPVAYLTGRREFYGHSFRITPAVLIPRPETELLVELALERLPAAHSARVLDLGTGSGCIALSVASERSRSKIIATDQCPAALALARDNALALGVRNVAFIESDWFLGLAADARFDVIVSNPPYVATGDSHLERGDLRFEPHTALTAGADGLDAIRTIISGAARHLSPGGWLLLEHGFAHGPRVRALLAAAGYDHVFSTKDLAAIERVSGGRLTVPHEAR